MAKRIKELPKTATSLASLPDDLHVSLPDELNARQIKMRVDGKEHGRATCTRCDIRYAYTGKNPGYCPACLQVVENRGKVKEEMYASHSNTYSA